MPNSNDVASNEVLWEHVLSLLVVGASVLGGCAVLLIQAFQQYSADFHKRWKRVLSGTRAKLSGEGVSNETSNKASNRKFGAWRKQLELLRKIER